MHITLCSKICVSCILFGIKTAKEFLLSIDANIGAPLVSGFLPTHAKKRIVAMRTKLILKIFTSAYIAQIRYAVIKSIPVEMIYLPIWPFSMHVQPRKPMRTMQSPINTYFTIPIFFNSAGHTTNHSISRGLCFPGECPRIRAIIEGFTESLLSNHLCDRLSIINFRPNKPVIVWAKVFSGDGTASRLFDGRTALRWNWAHTSSPLTDKHRADAEFSG